MASHSIDRSMHFEPDFVGKMPIDRRSNGPRHALPPSLSCHFAFVLRIAEITEFDQSRGEIGRLQHHKACRAVWRRSPDHSCGGKCAQYGFSKALRAIHRLAPDEVIEDRSDQIVLAGQIAASGGI